MREEDFGISLDDESIDPIIIDAKQNPVMAVNEIFKQNAVPIARTLVGMVKDPDNGVNSKLKVEVGKYILDYVLKSVSADGENDPFARLREVLADE